METENFLTLIHEGMQVFDRLHNQLGTVDRVRMTDDPAAVPEADADVPGDVRARLREEGFLHFENRWVAAANRYIRPEQIMSVSGNAVVLTVSNDELMRNH
jgi:hypothetical protein